MHPPGPKGWPLLGHAPDYFRDPLNTLTRWSQEYGDLVSLSFLGKPTYLVTSPEGIDHVLLGAGKRYVKGFREQRLKSPFGNGLLLSEGEIWLRQRRLMQPAFNREQVAAYAQGLPAATRSFTERWQPGEVLSLDSELMALMRELFVTLLIADETSVDRPPLYAMLAEIQAYFARMLSSPVSVPDWMPTPANQRFQAALAGLKSLIACLVREPETGGMLSLLVQVQQESQGAMSLEQLQDEVLSLFLAGHETTALTLIYALNLLAEHPEVDDRLYQEIEAVLGDRLPTLSDLSDLPYARHVVTETLRLYPPVHAMVREAIEPDELSGYPIPKGALMVLPQWVVHRDERLYDDPLRFRPERWEGGLERRLPRFAYFPFGGGSRLCIGNHLSLVEAVLVLVTIVQRYRFTRADAQPLELHAAVTLTPRRSLRMRVEPRSRLAPATSSSAPSGPSRSE